jgi:hypothetical protein
VSNIFVLGQAEQFNILWLAMGGLAFLSLLLMALNLHFACNIFAWKNWLEPS